MNDLGGTIELINASKSAEEAFQHFCAAMAEYGYERVVYSLVTDHPSLSLPKQHGLATSYPEHWMKYYVEKNYLAIDPVFTGALKSRVPFFWADLKNDPDIPETSFKVLDQGAEAGLKDGIGIPLFGKNGEITGVGLARAESETGKDYQFMANAYLLSTYFHEKYRSLIQPSVISKITQKEHDIIAWAAEGKTDEEIAVILNLSAHTVRWHWKKIFTKLDARGRLYAITKAISMGLVTPARISPP